MTEQGTTPPPPPEQPNPPTMPASGRSYPLAGQTVANQKLILGLLGILIGHLGIHKFLLGYTVAGVIMLAVSILTCGIGAIVMWVIGIIEGIMYLTKSDEEFTRIYVQGEKPWL